MAISEALAYSVTADVGTVHAPVDDEHVRCVRLTFHHGLRNDDHGGLTEVHSEMFAAEAALRPLIGQLESLARQLGL